MNIKQHMLCTVFFLSFTQHGFGAEGLRKKLNDFASRIKEQDRQQQAAYGESYLRHTQIVHKTPQKKFDPIAEKRTVETVDISFELNHK